MSISPSRLSNYANIIISDDECLLEIQRRMTYHYYKEFVDARDDMEKRKIISAKQDLLSDFLREFRIIVAESKQFDEAARDADQS